MAFDLQKRISRKFDDEIRFFKGWMDGPKTVGAIIPTSPVTARRMASVVDPASGHPVLELGPGTGVVTKAILQRGVKPEDLVSIEYSADFHGGLVRDYPGVRFINGDAFELETTLGTLDKTTFDCVISCLPLLNFPMSQRVALIENLLNRLPHGRPLIQISYGATAPVAARQGSFSTESIDWILRNIPPARLWVYRRTR